MRKEKYEWIHSWCDDTDREDIPRVLLVGDSITNGYQGKVRDLLKNKCQVDYIATSYAVDCLFFNQLITDFAADSKYAIVHFNHGLHGMHMTTPVYEAAMDILASRLVKDSKVIFVTSTKTYKPGTDEPTGHNPLVMERNEAVVRLAEKYSSPVDDLYAVSDGLGMDAYSQDGTHFADTGYTTLAQAVADSILAAL